MKILFYKILLLINLFFILNQISYSEELDSNKTTENNHDEVNYFSKGSWALQFAIDKNFKLTNFEGTTLSVKRQFSSKIALRFGFNGSYYEINYNINFKDFTSSLSINLALMYYLNPTENFKIYGYIGGQYSSLPRTYINEIDYYIGERYGPLLGIGAEYFVFNQLSLFAEYSYSFNFGKDIYYDIGFGVSETSKSVISLNSNPVKFGLSVYF